MLRWKQILCALGLSAALGACGSAGASVDDEFGQSVGR